MSGNYKLTLIIMVVVAALAGCTTAQNVGSVDTPAWESAGAASRAGFNLDVSADSYIDGGGARGYDLEIEDFGQDIVVSVNVDDASGLKALYFELEYNPEQYRPMTAEPTEAMAERENLINLTSMQERGTVIYGQVVANYHWRTGLTGDGTVAQVMFRKEATPALPRVVSAAPTDDASASILLFDETNATAELRWDYANRGDYDQNSQVNISDLTPLGANLNESVAPAKFPRASNLSVVDGDDNGQINVSDLTPLGAALNKSRISGYNVYCTTNEADRPGDDNSTPSPESARVGTVQFSEKQGLATERAFWTFDLVTLPANAYYWVRPFDAAFPGEEGTPSNVTGNVPSPGLTLQTPPPGPDPGDGSAGDPYKVGEGDEFTLILIDPTDGDVSTSADTEYFTSDPLHVTFSPTNKNEMTVGTGANEDFTVWAQYNGVNSNTLNFTTQTTPTDLFIMPLDKGAEPWASVPNIGDPLGGTDPDHAYILHDSTFNPDSDTDGVYDLEFPLRANTQADGLGTDIPVDSLTWGSFPPFTALDINDGSPGTFHANQFTNGYIFALDGANESNHLYVVAQLDLN